MKSFKDLNLVNLNHLDEVGETYVEHLWCTFKYACLFVGLAIIIMIHGLIPFILTKTASTKIRKLNEDLVCKQPKTHSE